MTIRKFLSRFKRTKLLLCEIRGGVLVHTLTNVEGLRVYVIDHDGEESSHTFFEVKHQTLEQIETYINKPKYKAKK